MSSAGLEEVKNATSDSDNSGPRFARD